MPLVRLAGEVVAEEETITLVLLKMLAEQGAVAKSESLVGR